MEKENEQLNQQRINVQRIKGIVGRYDVSKQSPVVCHTFYVFDLLLFNHRGYQCYYRSSIYSGSSPTAGCRSGGAFRPLESLLAYFPAFRLPPYLWVGLSPMVADKKGDELEARSSLCNRPVCVVSSEPIFANGEEQGIFPGMKPVNRPFTFYYSSVVVPRKQPRVSYASAQLAKHLK